MAKTRAGAAIRCWMPNSSGSFLMRKYCGPAAGPAESALEETADCSFEAAAVEAARRLAAGSAVWPTAAAAAAAGARRRGGMGLIII